MIRFLLASLVLLIAATTARGGDLPPASPDEPKAAVVSIKRAAAYLDAAALDWTRERKCGTCHTNYAYMISRPAIGRVGPDAAMKEIRGYFESRAAHWDDPAKGSKPRFDAEVIATAVTLAMNDAATTGTLHPTTRRALDRIWTLQRDDGSFHWLKCEWPPYEHDDYYGVVFTALGVGLAPDAYARGESAARGLEKLKGYLATHPAPDLHHRAYLLWASLQIDGLMTPEVREQTRRDLLALQRPDGGWSLPTLGAWKRHDGTPNPKDGPSDGYATGLVVYLLRRSGTKPDDPTIRRGVAWLESNQRQSGRWFTRSLSTDKYHYISNAGTGLALMALSACR